MKFVILLFVALTLSSCSLFSPVNLSKDSTYMLNAAPQLSHKKRMHSITLLVLTPETRPAYNTTQMAYSIKPYQVGYFSQNQWAETPSQMIQPLMVQTLQSAHYFHAVVT